MTSYATAIASGLAGIALLCAPAAFADGDALAEQDAWVEGNLLFLAYHEVGHLLLDQVLNYDQTEDRLAAEMRADDTATWLLSPETNEDAESAEAIAALEGWLAAADGEGELRTPDADLYPKAEVRASRIACLLIGSVDTEPNPFEDLRDLADLHFEVSNCSRYFQELDEEMVADYGGAESTRRGSKARVSVVYDPAPAALQEARDFLVKSRVLDYLKEDLVEYIGKPVTVVLRGASCGQSSPGFKYSPARREITACYEEVDWFLFGDSQAGVAAAARDSRADDALGARPRRIAPRQPQAQLPTPPRR